MIKLAFTLRRRPDLSREQFQRYWREQHAPLVRGHAETLRIRRYVQLHTRETAADEGLREHRSHEEPYDGVAELWFDSVEDLMAAFGNPEGQTAAAELLEDEARFVDLQRSPIWLGEENV
ncbi:MAG: EthD domain-containing protein, partial [Thermoleophilaceae bacterium]